MKIDDQCCWWGGKTIKTTRTRHDMWTMAMHSHYVRHATDKARILLLLFFLVDHPRWSLCAARIARNNMRMPHEP